MPESNQIVPAHAYMHIAHGCISNNSWFPVPARGPEKYCVD